MEIGHVELTPSRVFSNPSSPKISEAKRCIEFWAEFGITPIAMQALLFGRTDLSLFDPITGPKALVAYLEPIIIRAGQMGLEALVFGSPGNRVIPQGLSPEQALEVAIPFFRHLGEIAWNHGTTLCIEPNPEVYGCNFIVNAAEGFQLVEAVDSKGFRLHLDLAGMWLAGDDYVQSIRSTQSALKHFHLSAPRLEWVRESDLPLEEVIQVLNDCGYEGGISVEMRSDEAGNSSRVEQTMSYVQRFI